MMNSCRFCGFSTVIAPALRSVRARRSRSSMHRPRPATFERSDPFSLRRLHRVHDGGPSSSQDPINAPCHRRSVPMSNAWEPTRMTAMKHRGPGRNTVASSAIASTKAAFTSDQDDIAAKAVSARVSASTSGSCGERDRACTCREHRRHARKREVPSEDHAIDGVELSIVIRGTGRSWQALRARSSTCSRSSSCPRSRDSFRTPASRSPACRCARR